MKKYQNILYQDETVKRVFTPFPMVSYRNARKLSNYFVRAKLYPLKRKKGSYNCGSSRCQVCNNIEETEIFSSTFTGKTYKITRGGFTGWHGGARPPYFLQPLNVFAITLKNYKLSYSKLN